jgi:hypothetical protein
VQVVAQALPARRVGVDAAAGAGRSRRAAEHLHGNAPARQRGGIVLMHAIAFGPKTWNSLIR